MMALRYWRMCCEAISETWTARDCRLKTADFFDSIGEQPFAFSAHTGAGRKEILAAIAEALAA